MFKKMDLKSAKTRFEQVTPAKPAKPAKDIFAEFSNFSDFSRGEPQNSHFLQSENDDPFHYLHQSITTGDVYARLWPNVRSYCRRQLTLEQFSQLEAAFKGQSKTNMEVAV